MVDLFLKYLCNTGMTGLISLMYDFVYRLQSGDWNVSRWIQPSLLQGKSRSGNIQNVTINNQCVSIGKLIPVEWWRQAYWGV